MIDFFICCFREVYDTFMNRKDEWKIQKSYFIYLYNYL